jgi:outer membrane murein-binding lipoprotein Lpp
MLASIEESLKA